MEQLVEETKCFINTKLSKTILKKVRNHGGVTVKIQPFYPVFFEKMIIPLADRHESWKVVNHKSARFGKRTTIKIPDYFASLDEAFGDWRKHTVYIPFPKSPSGKFNDGYYLLNSNEKLILNYNYTKLCLMIKFSINRYNSRDVFQG